MHKQELLQKYLNNTCTSEEMHMLYKFLQEDDEEAYQDVMHKIWTDLHPSQPMDEEVSARMYGKIIAGINSASVNKRKPALFRRYDPDSHR